MNMNASDELDALDDTQAAAAFRRLVRHLRHRHDAQNIELMGLSGFLSGMISPSRDMLVRRAAPPGAA